MEGAVGLVQSVLKYGYDFVWTERYWLANNYTWAQIEEVSKTTVFPQASQLLVALGLSLVLLCFRFLWERFIAYPVGKYFRIKETSPRPPIHCDVLEKAFSTKKAFPTERDLDAYSKQLDWTNRQVERWWRKRRVVHKPSEMRRWTETSWRCLFYISIFYYGLFIHLDKPWFYETQHCWNGWPYQDVTPGQFWYYMFELAFYCSSILSLTMDHQRKDFNEMMVHHFATIVLLTMSWIGNYIRMGGLILVCHDAVDYFMEGAKLAHYMKWEKLCNTLFVTFAVMWFITRIYLYPTRILYSSFFEFYAHFSKPIFTTWYIQVTLLVALQVLHVMWFIMILRMVYRFLMQGEIKKDERSETEPDSSDNKEE